MIDKGKRNVLGVLIDALDYEAAVARIITAANAAQGYSVSALAIHGVITTAFDPEHRYRLNHFDLVTPDGQGVRWAVDWLHNTKLPDRVYGPRMTLDVCDACAKEGLPVYLYGSKREVLKLLEKNLKDKYPSLIIAGATPSKFRCTSAAEKIEIAQMIKASGAKVVLIGLGCPRQEVFAYEYRDLVSMPLLAVGAAFDYHAGMVKEPPLWIQRIGGHGFYRAFQDPRRLWKRFFLLPPIFLSLMLAQKIGIWRPDTQACVEPNEDVLYG